MLFQMATGSGKTLVMAALMLYLYHKGFRKFLFFVNSTTILEKTKDNFLLPSSNKYLFAQNIEIDGRRIHIKVVNTLEEADNENINIIFTTIQGLHTTLHAQRENAPTFEDFSHHDVVLLADEAHHNNTQSKQRELELEASWENTVEQIFKGNANNYLIELTATANLEHPSIQQKYAQKHLFNYALKEFRIDGYSKNIRVVDTTLDKKWRILLSLIISEYRRFVAGERHLQIKPIILFKSETIKKSTEHHAIFKTIIEEINMEDFDQMEHILHTQKQNNFLEHIARFILEEKTFLLNNFKRVFHESRCINVNDDTEKSVQQKLLNSLEDAENNVRVIFAVNKLNEGWDVLNLFDIVKLFSVKNPKTTSVSEVQLIGRGARYYPFLVDDQLPLDKTDDNAKYIRKYDDEVEIYKSLQVLEQLHYHTLHEVDFITELNKQLEQIGLTDGAMKEVKISLLPFFVESNFYRTGYVYMNKKEKRVRKFSTSSKRTENYIFDEDMIDIISDIQENIIYHLSQHIEEHDIEAGLAQNDFKEHRTIFLRDKEIDARLFYKAMSSDTFFQMDTINTYVNHNMNSVLEFKEVCKNCSITFQSHTKIQEIPSLDMYKALCELLQRIKQTLDIHIERFGGTRTFYPKPVKEVFKNVKYNVPKDQSRNSIVKDASDITYFAQDSFYGDSSYEKELLQELSQYFTDYAFRGNYQDVYLLRNYRQVKIFNFEDGRGFEPDFLLFFRKYKKAMVYQLFIESKGEHLAEHDRWKEEFLTTLCQLDSPDIIRHDAPNKYKIIGIPFYSANNNVSQEGAHSLTAFMNKVAKLQDEV